MSDILDVQGEEARRAVAAFLGQNMGSVKDLNSRLIEQATSLKPVIPDVQNILKSVPGGTPVIPTPQFEPVSQPPSIQMPMQMHLPVPGPAPTNTNQLELNFTYDIAKDIVDRLERVEQLLKRLTQNLPATKKPEMPLKKT